MEVKKLLKNTARLLIVEPHFHVNKSQFKVMLNEVRALGYTVLDLPKKKGGRSAVLKVSG